MPSYHNSNDLMEMKAQAVVVFKEMSTGIYCVPKDNTQDYPLYVSAQEVVQALNEKSFVAVVNREYTGYANFEIE